MSVIYIELVFIYFVIFDGDNNHYIYFHSSNIYIYMINYII